MLDTLREAFPEVGAAWTPGEPFVCDCAATAGQPILLGALGDEPGDLRIGGRRLRIRADEPLVLRLVAHDVIAGTCGDDEFVIAFRDARTLVGVLPAEACLEIVGADSATCLESEETWSAIADDHALVVLWEGPLFALAIGSDLVAATAAAQNGIGDLPWQQAEQRLAQDEHVTAAPLDDD